METALCLVRGSAADLTRAPSSGQERCSGGLGGTEGGLTGGGGERSEGPQSETRLLLKDFDKRRKSWCVVLVENKPFMHKTLFNARDALNDPASPRHQRRRPSNCLLSI